MTMLQVMLIEKFRGINTPEMQTAVDIIDTQARELIEARDTIARYEAMMEGMGSYIQLPPIRGGDQETWLQQVNGEWAFHRIVGKHYANHAGGWKNIDSRCQY